MPFEFLFHIISRFSLQVSHKIRSRRSRARKQAVSRIFSGKTVRLILMKFWGRRVLSHEELFMYKFPWPSADVCFPLTIDNQDCYFPIPKSLDFYIVGACKHIFEDFKNELACNPGPSGRLSACCPRPFGPRVAIEALLWTAGA